jgi:hypothetical protein
MNDELWCVICVSSAQEDLTMSEAEQMLTYARTDRQSKNITSLVLYANKNVLILLEGNKAKVQEELQILTVHSGHHSLIKMYDKPITERYFGDYPLVFKSLSKDYQNLDDFKEPEQLEYFNEFLSLNQPIPIFVKSFIKNNG